MPTAHKEGALALGATHWEMIRTAVLPFGKPGIISASMLGLGPRARRDPRRRHPALRPELDGRLELVDLQRRLHLRVEDRQRRQRVRQPAEDRRLHRRRPGAVRAHLRRQRGRPHRHRAQEGLHRMSTVQLDTTTTAPPARPARPELASKSVVAGHQGPPRAGRDVGRVLHRRHPAGLDPRQHAPQGRPDAARVARGGPTRRPASPRGGSAAAPRTPSRERSTWPW